MALFIYDKFWKYYLRLKLSKHNITVKVIFTTGGRVGMNSDFYRKIFWDLMLLKNQYNVASIWPNISMLYTLGLELFFLLLLLFFNNYPTPVPPMKCVWLNVFDICSISLRMLYFDNSLRKKEKYILYIYLISPFHTVIHERPLFY